MPGRNLRMAQRTLRVPVVNLTGEIIPEGAVAFDRSGEAFPGVVPVVPATEETTLFGIITQPLPPSTYGDAVVSGVVEVTLENGADATHAAPGSDGKLQSADGGRAEILFYDAENSRALLLLGAGGGESAIPAYRGMFKVDRKIELVPVEPEPGQTETEFVPVEYLAIFNGEHPNETDPDTAPPAGFIDSADFPVSFRKIPLENINVFGTSTGFKTFDVLLLFKPFVTDFAPVLAVRSGNSFYSINADGTLTRMNDNGYFQQVVLAQVTVARESWSEPFRFDSVAQIYNGFAVSSGVNRNTPFFALINPEGTMIFIRGGSVIFPDGMTAELPDTEIPVSGVYTYIYLSISRAPQSHIAEFTATPGTTLYDNKDWRNIRVASFRISNDYGPIDNAQSLTDDVETSWNYVYGGKFRALDQSVYDKFGNTENFNVLMQGGTVRFGRVAMTVPDMIVNDPTSIYVVSELTEGSERSWFVTTDPGTVGETTEVTECAYIGKSSGGAYFTYYIDERDISINDRWSR